MQADTFAHLDAHYAEIETLTGETITRAATVPDDELEGGRLSDMGYAVPVCSLKKRK